MPAPKGMETIPRLTMTGIAKYMASSDAAKREKLLYDYKFPDPEGKAQADYYNYAKGSIRDYHHSANALTVLDVAMSDMQRKMLGASQQAQAKLENNYRVVTSYRSHFGDRRYKPCEHQPLEVLFEGVQLRLRPHLIATENKKTRVIQYAYGKDGATDMELLYSKQLLFFYAQQLGIEIRPCDCLLLEIATGKIYPASPASRSFVPKLKATMREVQRAWAVLEQYG